MNKVKNLGYDRQLLKKQLRQESGVFVHDSLLGPPVPCRASQKLGNSNMLYYKKNPVKIKYCELSSSYRGLLSNETKTSEGKVSFDYGV